MTKTNQSTRPSFSGLREDILGAGLHLLSGAGGDLKLLVQHAVKTVLGDAYVSRSDYDSLAARVSELEAILHKQHGGVAVKKPKKPSKKPRK